MIIFLFNSFLKNYKIKKKNNAIPTKAANLTFIKKIAYLHLIQKNLQ